MYEYSIIVRTLEIKAEELADATFDQLHLVIGAALTQTIAYVEEGLETFQGGGWELVSHELSNIADFMVVSFLLRRPKR